MASKELMNGKKEEPLPQPATHPPHPADYHGGDRCHGHPGYGALVDRALVLSPLFNNFA